MPNKPLPSCSADDYDIASKEDRIEFPNSADVQPSFRRLRSNYTFPLEEKKPERELEYLPFVEYDGKIEYYTTMQDMAFSCDELERWVQQQPADVVPIAFDLEWPFSFQTGPGRTALMQLCASTDRCILLQLSCLKKRLPAALLHLLYHPKVVLHGVNIKADFRKLARDFPETDADRLIERCVELGQWCNALLGSCGIWSLQRLVEKILRQRISKDKRVRMSKWDVLPLTNDQKRYAAIDVYVCILIARCPECLTPGNDKEKSRSVGQQLYTKLAEEQIKQDA